MRVWIAAMAVVAVVFGTLAGAALLAWPRPQIRAADDALARVVLSGYAGSITAVDVHSEDGTEVPVRLIHGRLWPLLKLAGGERLTVDLRARPPGWASWLVGHTRVRSLWPTLSTST